MRVLSAMKLRFAQKPFGVSPPVLPGSDKSPGPGQSAIILAMIGIGARSKGGARKEGTAAFQVCALHGAIPLLKTTRQRDVLSLGQCLQLLNRIRPDAKALGVAGPVEPQPTFLLLTVHNRNSTVVEHLIATLEDRHLNIHAIERASREGLARLLRASLFRLLALLYSRRIRRGRAHRTVGCEKGCVLRNEVARGCDSGKHSQDLPCKVVLSDGAAGSSATERTENPRDRA